MIVYGVDLALTKTGVARHRHNTLACDWHLWTITGKGDGPARLGQIRDALIGEIAATADTHCGEPIIVVLEGYSPDSRHQSHQLGEIGGVIRLALYEHGIDYVCPAPKQRAKYATGNGNAAKPMVMLEVGARWAQVAKPANDHEGDALVLASMALDHYGMPAVKLPQTHRAVLDAIAWPVLGGRGPAGSEVRADG